jgi:hypothetical protein
MTTVIKKERFPVARPGSLLYNSLKTKTVELSLLKDSAGVPILD